MRLGDILVEIVPDDDEAARRLIRPDILSQLGDGVVLMNGSQMYVRHSTWERIKHRFIEKKEARP